MFEETLYQSTKDGKPFVDMLGEQGIKPGIKVDTGLQVLPGTNGETATQGLDGLGDRMKAFREQVRSACACVCPISARIAQMHLCANAFDCGRTPQI